MIRRLLCRLGFHRFQDNWIAYGTWSSCRFCGVKFWRLYDERTGNTRFARYQEEIMSLTTDPKDPRLSHYTAPEAPAPQAEVYLVLSNDEIAKGFTRPFRDKYRHLGAPGPRHPLRKLTDEEKRRYADVGYVAFEAYPPGDAVTGRFWTQAQLDNVGTGCGGETRMGEKLSETYARQPKFYGATFCVHCSAHFPVGEFVWSADGEIVGS